MQFGKATNLTQYINHWEFKKNWLDEHEKNVTQAYLKAPYVSEGMFLQYVCCNISDMVQYLADNIYPSYEELHISGYAHVLGKALKLPSPKESAMMEDSTASNYRLRNEKLEREVSTVKKDTEKLSTDTSLKEKTREHELKQTPSSALKFKATLFQPPQTYGKRVKQKAKDVEGKCNQLDVEEIMRAAGNREVDNIKKILDKNVNLIYVQGSILDVTETEYENVTLLQYFWSLGDTDMCSFVTEYLSPLDAAIQINAIEKEREDVKPFTLDETLKQYSKYVDNYDKLSEYEGSRIWQDGIGKEQLKWPPYMRYEFIKKDQYESTVN